MSVKGKSLNIRISESDKQLLNRAASMLGLNLTSFVLQSAMNRAQKALEHEKHIELKPAEMKKLLEIMDSKESDKELEQAFAHYNAAIK
jgi:uncharacterized protein (DUF1778 family)